MKINLKNLNKAIVLMVLYNNSKSQGMSFLGGDGSAMNVEEATERLKSQTSFDYLNGKVMKIELGGDILETWLYDRDNGDGAALRAIKSQYPDVTEMTQDDLNKLQAEGRVNRNSQNTKVVEVIELADMKKLKGEATDTTIPLSKREQRLVEKNEKAYNYYKATGKILQTPKPKKNPKAKIEYRKGFFTVNGEVRKETKNKYKDRVVETVGKLEEAGFKAKVDKKK